MRSVVDNDDSTTVDQLEDAYANADGVVMDAARELGLSEDAARHRLMKHGIHEPISYQPHQLAESLPQEVGLSHLRCGNCRTEIDRHPCVECGWMPGNAQSTITEFNGGGN